MVCTIPEMSLMPLGELIKVELPVHSSQALYRSQQRFFSFCFIFNDVLREFYIKKAIIKELFRWRAENTVLTVLVTLYF